MFISKKKYRELESRLHNLEQQVFEDSIHHSSWIWPPYDTPTLKGKLEAVIKQQRLEIEVKDEKRTVIAKKKR